VEKLNWAKGIERRAGRFEPACKPTAEGHADLPRIHRSYQLVLAFLQSSTHLSISWRRKLRSLLFEARGVFLRQDVLLNGSAAQPGDNRQKILLAYSLESDKPAWRFPQVGSGHSAGGTMTTAGGLLFFGDDAQSFEAVDAQTGKPLWHFNTGQGMHASPMSYAVNGKQYVAIAAGSDIFSFGLP